MNSTLPIIYVPLRITNLFICEHREYNFLYSFDYHKKSAMGQCIVAHGESNTYPIPVLIKFCASPVYFQNFEEAKKMMQEFLDVIPLDKPMIPFPKIGLGFSRLKEFSLKSYLWLHQELDKIKYPNIKWI